MLNLFTLGVTTTSLYDSMPAMTTCIVIWLGLALLSTDVRFRARKEESSEDLISESIISTSRIKNRFRGTYLAISLIGQPG